MHILDAIKTLFCFEFLNGVAMILINLSHCNKPSIFMTFNTIH